LKTFQEKNHCPQRERILEKAAKTGHFALKKWQNWLFYFEKAAETITNSLSINNFHIASLDIVIEDSFIQPKDSAVGVYRIDLSGLM
jgi:hypothetical protein